MFHGGQSEKKTHPDLFHPRLRVERLFARKLDHHEVDQRASLFRLHSFAADRRRDLFEDWPPSLIKATYLGRGTISI